MAGFNLFPIRSYQALLPAYERSIRHREARFGVGTRWQDILVSRVLSYSAGLIERGTPVSSFGGLKRYIVAVMTTVVEMRGRGRATIRSIRGWGLIDVGRGRIWRERLLGILGIGRSMCARRALARIIHGKDGLRRELWGHAQEKGMEGNDGWGGGGKGERVEGAL
jgi:hypothetical protein